VAADTFDGALIITATRRTSTRKTRIRSIPAVPWLACDVATGDNCRRAAAYGRL